MRWNLPAQFPWRIKNFKNDYCYFLIVLWFFNLFGLWNSEIDTISFRMWFLFYLCKPCFLLALQIVCSNNFMPKLVTIFCIIMNLKCMNSLYIIIRSYFPGCNYKIYCSLPTWFKGSHANNAILLYSLYLIICCRQGLVMCVMKQG